MIKWLLLTLALVGLLAGAWVAWAFQRDMGLAYARLAGRSTLLSTPLGEIEYTLRGSGPPVLVVHGSGSGFDQAEFLADAVLGPGFQSISPSRFGYLRSTLPAGASFDDQAHAFALLLDHLGLRRVAVLAFSHGGPSALLFARLYPERVSSLTLLSAGVAASSEPAQQQANRQGDALRAIFQSDFLYWALTRGARARLLALMGVDEAVTASLSPEQNRLSQDLLWLMNPVAPRAAGVRFDNQARMPNERIAGLPVPTLVVHARDDSLQRFAHAEFALRHIPGAELLAFERGGHLVGIVQQAAIRERLARHLHATD